MKYFLHDWHLPCFQCTNISSHVSSKQNNHHDIQYTIFDHYDDVIMGAIASQIASLTIVYSTVYSDADHTKHQSSASLAFGRGFHREPVNSPHKGPVTRKMFPFDDVTMHFVFFQTFSNIRSLFSPVLHQSQQL